VILAWFSRRELRKNWKSIYGLLALDFHRVSFEFQVDSSTGYGASSKSKAKLEVQEFRKVFQRPFEEAIAYCIGSATRPFPTLPRDVVVQKVKPKKLKKDEDDKGVYIVSGYIAVKDVATVDKLVRALTGKVRRSHTDSESLCYNWRRRCVMALLELGKSADMNPTLSRVSKCFYTTPYPSLAVLQALVDDPCSLARIAMVCKAWSINCRWTEDQLWRDICVGAFVTRESGTKLKLADDCYEEDKLMKGWRRDLHLPWKKAYGLLYRIWRHQDYVPWRTHDGAIKLFRRGDDYLMGFKISNVDTAVPVGDPRHPWPRLAEVDLSPHTELQLKRTLACFARLASHSGSGATQMRDTKPGEGCRFFLLNWRFFVLQAKNAGWAPTERAPIWTPESFKVLTECVATCRRLCPGFQVPAPGMGNGLPEVPEEVPAPLSIELPDIEEEECPTSPVAAAAAEAAVQEEENWATIEREILGVAPSSPVLEAAAAPPKVKIDNFVKAPSVRR